jgi:ubiquinone biosynthesis protein
MEARNAEQFHRNFAGHPHVRVPRVYWSYSRARVLTLELLEGVHVRDIEVATYTVEERRRLAYLIAEAWMTMIFRHGFFHGDPHPSNIMVLAQRDQIGLVDFGTAGALAADDTSKLTGLFIDAVNQNIEALPKRLAGLGVRYPKEKEEEFVAELRDVFYRYYRMHLTLPTRFVLLDRAIATLGSVGVELYPDFNVFEVAKPYARELMLERFTPQRVVARAQQEARNYVKMMLELPYQVHDVLQEVRDGQVEVGFRHEGLDDLFHHLDRVVNRLAVALIAVGGVVGSSLIGVFAEEGTQIFGIHFLSVIGFSLSALLGIWLVWSVIRSGRL